MTFNYAQQMTTLEGPCVGCGMHVVKRVTVQTAKMTKTIVCDKETCKRKAAKIRRIRKGAAIDQRIH